LRCTKTPEKPIQQKSITTSWRINPVAARAASAHA